MNFKPLLIMITLLLALQAWAQEKPRKAYQLFEQAEEVFNDGNFTMALALLDECLTQKPGYMEAYPLRANAKEQLNDLDGALTDYSIFLEEFPEHPDVLMSRGVLRYKLGFFDQAREDFQKVLRTESNETNSIFYKQNMSTDDRNPIITTSGENHNPYVLNYLGLIEYKLDNPETAIIYFDSAIRAYPKDPDFYVNRGLAKEILQDSTSMFDYEMALRYNPNHTLAKHNLEALKAKKTQSMSIEDRLTMTIEADSTMLFPYLERAQQRYEAGYYEGALDDYNQAVALAPSNFEVLFARGLTREKLKDYEGAFSDYTKAIDFKEDYPKVWLSRGNVLLKLERYRDAIEDYNVALVYDANYSLAFHNRGMAKFKLKKDKEACADFKRAEELGLKVDGKLKSKVCD
jgi:tetratricopeptide (TPR) repeat protein